MTVKVFSQSLWNTNLGSVYRDRFLLVSLGKEKLVDLNVLFFILFPLGYSKVC